MGADTKIEWCDFTFNSWLGCSKVSPGCDHCYAERFGKRFGIAWGPGQPRKRTSDANWREPLRWNARAEREGRRYRVFCASLADVFDNEVPTGWRVDLFDLILRTPRLAWLLLTKRIGNVRSMLPTTVNNFAAIYPNVWLGATVVNQEEADRDIPKLLATPAAVRFLSIEPILGEIELSRWMLRCDHGSLPAPGGGVMCDRCNGNGHGCPRIDWVICGGESGPHARPTNVEWIRSIVRQCREAGVPVFVKQGGSSNACVHDRKGGHFECFPLDLQVREFPNAA